MKSIIIALLLAAPASAGVNYNLSQTASSATMVLNGRDVFQRLNALDVSTGADHSDILVFRAWQSTASPVMADLFALRSSTIAGVDYGLRGSTMAFATNAGNAGTVTNGLYSNQNYINPTWLQGISGAKVDLSTMSSYAQAVSSAVSAIALSTPAYSSYANALKGTPTKCSAGNYPLGVDAQGNAQNCTATGAGWDGSTPLSVTSTITVGNTASYSSALSFGKAVKGAPFTAALSSFTAATSFSFTNWRSSVPCDIDLYYTQNTAEGAIYFQINGDTGAHYWYGHRGYSTNGVDSINYSIDGNATKASLNDYGSSGGCGSSYCPQAAGRVHFYLRVRAYPPSRMSVTVDGTGVYTITSAIHMIANFASGWYNAAPPTDITFTVGGGTMTGYAEVICRLQEAAY